MIKSQIEISPELYKYIVDKTVNEPIGLNILSREQSSIDDKILQITPHQGQFISWLIKLINPNLTLDIGTYKGYSALCVALATKKECKTITIDCNEELANIAKKYWYASGVENKIEFLLGNASDTLDNLNNNGYHEAFDFIFIDADKSNYKQYYEQSLLLLKQGGVIAIDNMLYFGTVIGRRIIDEDIKKWVFKDGVKAIKSLNELIKNDNRVESVLLPIADGLTLIRKL